MNIHPTVIIEEDVNIDSSVEIDAYSIIRTGTAIGSGTKIGTHVEIAPFTKIGCDNKIYKGSYLGGSPQDINYDDRQVKAKQAKPLLKIGNGNTIREYVTMHHSTTTDQPTQLGNNNYLMAHCHVAHDCLIRNHVIIANYSSLAGFVFVDDHAFISGSTVVHQYVRIGKHAMIGGLCRISQDVAPYAKIADENSKLCGINWIGLKRAGWNDDKLLQLKKVFKTLFHQKSTLKTNIKEVSRLELEKKIPLVTNEIKEFMIAIENSSRGLITKWYKQI